MKIMQHEDFPGILYNIQSKFELGTIGTLYGNFYLFSTSATETPATSTPTPTDTSSE